MVRVALIALALALTACRPAKTPELRVIGVADAPRNEVVFVQVTNPAKRPMTLTKLEYKFATSAATISEGSLSMHREVPAGAAIVVEVPLDADAPEQPMTLQGKLTAELDEIVRTFKVSAEIQPEQVTK
jgi:LEA14-like dessication related protein